MNQLAPHPFMGRLAAGIIKKKSFFFFLFIALFVFSLISLNWVKLESDISKYLSDDSGVRQCLKTVETEFSEFGRATIMAENVTDESVATLKAALEDYENVAYASPTVVPQADGTNAVRFAVAFNSSPESEETQATVEGLAQMLKGYPNTSIYCSVLEKAESLVVSQMAVVLVMVTIIVITVLIITTRSYAEVAVLVLTFLTAAAINMGTHFLLGSISIYSNAVAVVMQLALSLDYAIIFCNRYHEAHETLPYRPSVIKALAGSIPEILSSSLTTVAGLIAMTFMVFKLGGDMGIVLVKSIIISLLTVFLFMPALLLLFAKAIDRTEHRNFVPRIDFVGRFAFLSKRVVPAVFLCLVVVGFLFSSKVDYKYDTISAPSNRYTEARLVYLDMTEKVGMNQMELLVPSGDYRNESLLIQNLENLSGVRSVSGLANIKATDDYTLYASLSCSDFQKLSGLEDLTSRAVFAYYAASVGDQHLVAEDMASYRIPLLDLLTFLYNHKDDETLSLDQSYKDQITDLYSPIERILREMRGDNYSLIYIDSALPISSPETFEFIENLKSVVSKYYPQGGMLAGNSIMDYEFAQAFSTDKTTVSVLSIVMVLVILFFTFRSAVLPLVLILLIQGSIWMDFSFPALFETPVYFICYLIVSSLMMGSNIDYAIVMSSRYRELRSIGMDKLESIIDAVNFAFPTIITSGSVLALSGILMSVICTEGVLSGFGYYLGVGTAITLLLVLFVLPQLLLVADPLLKSLRIPSLRNYLPFFRRLGAGLMAVVSVFSLFMIPMGWNWASAAISQNTEDQHSLLQDIESAQQLNESFKASFTEIDQTRYSFAEQFLTHKIGYAKLDSSTEQYNEGVEQLAEGQKTYDENYAQFTESSEKFEAGKKALESGKSQYNSNLAKYQEGLATYQAGKKTYDDNLAQYNEGMAQYESGKATLDAAQAEYDSKLAQYNEGLAQYNAGKAEYDAAEAEYNTAKQKYETMKPVMDKLANGYDNIQDKTSGDGILKKGASAVLGLVSNVEFKTILEAAGLGDTFQGRSVSEFISDYQAAESELASAEKQLSDAKAQLTDAEAQLSSAKAQLADGEAQLNAGKAQLNDAKAQLDSAKSQLADGQAQLSSAEAQLASAEKQLANGKKEIASGEAQLADGQAQLSDAESQLADGKAQLDEGYEQLAEAEKQISEGQETLEENNAMLLASLTELDAYESRKTDVESSVSSLVAESGSALIGSTENYLDSLKDSCLRSIEADTHHKTLASVFLGLSLASALVSLLLVLLRNRIENRSIKLTLSGFALLTALISFIMACVLNNLLLWVLTLMALLLFLFQAVNFITLLVRHSA